MTLATGWKRAAGLAWIALALGLVAHEARQLDWVEVGRAVRGYGWDALAVALAIALPGYLACASYDFIGRHCTRHGLPAARTAAISFVGYCFSLNLGALIGGLGFRYRLYAPSGLSPWTIGQVIALSILTNWSGYVLLAGLLLAFDPPDLPPAWDAPDALLRGAGLTLLTAAAAYLWLCLRKGGEQVRLRDSELVVPGLGIAGVQLALSLVSWSAVGGVITWLLPEDVSWFAVMPVLLTSAIAGVVSHVPAGLGVMEVVFSALLGHEVAAPRLVGALLAFRATYYLVPFLLAVGVYAYLEATSGGPAVEPQGA